MTPHASFFDADQLSEVLALEHDALNPGLGGSAFAAHQLRARHLRYYRARIPQLVGEVDSPVGHGPCPFCAGAFQVGLVDGWWLCTGCYRQGEAYTLEYLLGQVPGIQAWEAARTRVERTISAPTERPASTTIAPTGVDQLQRRIDALDEAIATMRRRISTITGQFRTS